mmetsp:Transcript_135756/g.330004  ORF Transcript_135756/g.330004 Transcript_135756/m.330004 type:complete len:212 (-) Transcript_135756:823-1458(-)
MPVVPAPERLRCRRMVSRRTRRIRSTWTTCGSTTSPWSGGRRWCRWTTTGRPAGCSTASCLRARCSTCLEGTALTTSSATCGCTTSPRTAGWRSRATCTRSTRRTAPTTRSSLRVPRLWSLAPCGASPPVATSWTCSTAAPASRSSSSSPAVRRRGGTAAATGRTSGRTCLGRSCMSSRCSGPATKPSSRRTSASCWCTVGALCSRSRRSG